MERDCVCNIVGSGVEIRSSLSGMDGNFDAEHESACSEDLFRAGFCCDVEFKEWLIDTGISAAYRVAFAVVQAPAAVLGIWNEQLE